MTRFKGPRKRFGQNFLVDSTLIQRIIDSIGATATDTVVEIGPGRGAITADLLASDACLIAIELDRDLIPDLQSRFGNRQNFSLHQADALKFDFNELQQHAPLRLVGNLPYNIATPLLFHLLDFLPSIADMHFMLQWEVVARLAASSSDPHYGQLSVLVQNQCQVNALFQVPPTAFRPAPKVMSGIVRIVPRVQPQVAPQHTAHFTKLVKAAFAQRRKTLRNNLKQLASSDDFERAEVDPGKRAEQLNHDDFARLTLATAETT